jgi:hypothetical protein
MLAICGSLITFNFSLKPNLVPQYVWPTENQIIIFDQNLQIENSDGSGRTEFGVKYPGGLFFRGFPVKTYYQLANAVVSISTKHELLGFTVPRYFPGTGHPLIISKEGKSSYCDTNSTPNFSEYISILDDRSILGVFRIETKDRVVRFDMKSCQIVEDLYLAQEGESISVAAVSSKMWLAIVSKIPGKDSSLKIINGQGLLVSEIPHATWPTWSKDGTQIAYINGGFLWAADETGENQRKLTTALDSPSWSPDAKRIVFHEGYYIYVYDLVTGNRSKLDEGEFSVWVK